MFSDMTFTHDGNPTRVNGLVNFEKMHMLAQTMRTLRYCRSRPLGKRTAYSKVQLLQANGTVHKPLSDTHSIELAGLPSIADLHTVGVF